MRRARTRRRCGGTGERAVYRGHPTRFRSRTLALWLRADLGITLNATTVSAWADQSSAGNNATQATAGFQPLFVASGQGGVPTVSGQGTDDRMELAGPTLSATTTMLCVGSNSSSANGYLTSSTGNFGAFITNFGGVSFEWFNNTDRQTLSAGATGTHILSITQTDGANLSGYLDGNPTAVFSVVPGVVLAAKVILRVFCAASDASFATASISEFIVYKGVLSTPELGRLHNYAKARYAR